MAALLLVAGEYDAENWRPTVDDQEEDEDEEEGGVRLSAAQVHIRPSFPLCRSSHSRMGRAHSS